MYLIAPIVRSIAFCLLIRVLTTVTILTLCYHFARRLSCATLPPAHDELQRGAMMIGSGVLDYRIDLSNHRNDELGRLAVAFNDMGSLYQTQKQVKAYSRSLEAANEELDAMVMPLLTTSKVTARYRGLRGLGTGPR